ncbi:Glucanosyltransferase-domain-containing protein [Tricladium varicosporioides]|nr:Glucanosyltransferase-domain-containing protein [Hymenoscyphus varicosporioides]
MLKSLLVPRETAPAPITIRGDFFFYPNGTQFFIRGVNLNTTKLNVSKNITSCEEHIPTLLSLHVNTVWFSNVSSIFKYSTCLEALAAVNIYVVVDLSLNASDFTSEYTLNTWDLDIFVEFTSTIKSFANHTNVIGFTMGSNVLGIHSFEQDALPFLKAAMRDIRSHIAQNYYRQIPLGISAPNYSFNSDIAENFLSCTSIYQSVDFWAVRLDWCDNNYGNLTSTYRSYGIPVILGENRCSNTLNNNTFPEIATLYGPSLTPIFSGGFLRPYFSIPGTDTENGLFNTTTNTGLNEIASNFSIALSNVKPVALQNDSYTPIDSQVKACPTINPVWINYQTLPLLIDDSSAKVCKCMYDSLKCQVASDFGSGDRAFWNMIQLQNETTMAFAVANVTTPSYGAFSICHGYQRVSWVLDQLYSQQARAGANPSCNLILNERENPNPELTSECKDLIAKDSYIGGLISTPLEGANGGSLSRGAVAGVVIGVLFVISALVGAAVFFWRRKKQHRVRKVRSESPGGIEVRVEMETKNSKHLTVELAGDDHRESELWAAGEIVELPGSDGPQTAELHTEILLSNSDIKDRGAYTPIQTAASDSAEDPPETLVSGNDLLDSQSKEPDKSSTTQKITAISPQAKDGIWNRQEDSNHVVSPSTELNNSDDEPKSASTPKPQGIHL